MEALLNQSARKGTYNNKVKGAISIADLKRSDNNVFKTAEKGYKEKATLSTLSTATFGSTIQFRIPRSDGFISNMFLKIDTGGTATTGKYVGLNMIEYYEYELNNLKYTVDSLTLGQYLMTVNNLRDGRTLLKSLLGGDVRTTTAIPDVYIPLVGPGTNGIMQGVGNTYANPVWPIGKQKDDLIIRIRLKAVADFDTTSTATLTTISLNYDRYILDGDIGSRIPQSSQKSVIYSYNLVYFQSETIPATAKTATAVTRYELDSIVTDGDIKWMGFHVAIDAEYDTAKDPFETQQIEDWYIYFKGNKRIYEVTSNLEHTKDHMLQFRGLNLFEGTSSSYYYNIPISSNFSWNPTEIGAPGINFLNESVNLRITEPATDTTRLHIFAVYACRLQLLNDGSWAIDIESR